MGSRIFGGIEDEFVLSKIHSSRRELVL
jgi:hypothetical protein